MIAKPRRLREAPTKPPAPRRPVSAMPPCDLRTDATDGLFLPRLASLAAAACALESDGLALAKPFGATRASPTSVAANAQRRGGTAAERAQRGDFPRGRPAGSTPSWPRAADPSSRERRCTAPYRVGVSEERVRSVARRDHSLARPRERNPRAAGHRRAREGQARPHGGPSHTHRAARPPHRGARCRARGGEGRAARLLAQNGPFARLYRLQGIAAGEEAVRNGADHSTGSLNS